MNIFVGNIAFTASEDDLREFFEQHGTVDKVHLITDRYTGRSRGFGFVEMAPMADVAIAYSLLNKTILNGQSITIERDPSLKNGKGRTRSVER